MNSSMLEKTKFVMAEEDVHGETRITSEIEAEFSRDDFDLFRTFVVRSERLSDSTWVKEGMPSGLDITIEIPTGGLSGQAHVPNWDDVVVVLHKLRPFVLNDEALYFYKVAKIRAWRINNVDFRSQLEEAKNLFSGKKSQSEYRIEANGILLNCEDTLNKFLNSREYHHDEDKEVFMKSLEAILPDIDYIKPILCGLISDKVAAVFYLTEVVHCLLSNAGSLQAPSE